MRMMFLRKSELYTPKNKAIMRAFPHRVRHPDENWFDRHPVISGALYGVALVIVIWGVS